MDRGIVVAGNLIVDYVKEIDEFPEIGKLTTIRSVNRSSGGLAANVGVDLAKLDPFLLVKIVGKVGCDDAGDFLLDIFKENGIDISFIERVQGVQTSFTDVMSVRNGQRTFFTARGADSLLEVIPNDALNCDMFHIGYALLMDKLDEPDEIYGTKMAKVLHDVQAKGIKTSMDVISEVGNRFKKIVTPGLKYCNYIIINETESSMIADIAPRDEKGNIIEENIKKIMQFLLDEGVSELAVIHAAEGAWALTKDREYLFEPSVDLPRTHIIGTVGAGDAFCAGVLYSIYKGYDLKKTLQLGAAAAACNLSSANAIDGMRSEEASWDLFYSYL